MVQRDGFVHDRLIQLLPQRCRLLDVAERVKRAHSILYVSGTQRPVQAVSAEVQHLVYNSDSRGWRAHNVTCISEIFVWNLTFSAILMESKRIHFACLFHGE
eukprot:27386-Pelagomonas_calceolata.AAC.1